MKKFRLSPIAYDGWKFVLLFGITGFLCLFLDPWFQITVGVLCLFLAGFSVAFFRDPEREITATDGFLAPADGKVLEISTIDGEGYGPGRVIRIFMSVFDYHIQRSPAAGRVVSRQYSPGVFLDTRDPRAPLANENNMIIMETARGRIGIKQIAGLLARRIVCWVRPGDNVALGERIGLIRFGSQVDLYVPLETEILIKEGERVTAGQTVVAQWKSGVLTAPESSVIKADSKLEAGKGGNKK